MNKTDKPAALVAKLLIIDALADLRHACDETGWSFGTLDRLAHQHYMEERGSTKNKARAKRVMTAIKTKGKGR